MQTEWPRLFSPCIHRKGNILRPCPTIWMETYLFTVCFWSISALLTSHSPSTTQAATPGTRSRLEIARNYPPALLQFPPSSVPTAGYHLSIFLHFCGDGGTCNPSQETSCRPPNPPPFPAFGSSPCSALQKAKGLALIKTKPLSLHPNC